MNNISEEFKERLIKNGIDPSDVVKFTTENNKKKTRKLLQRLSLLMVLNIN